MSMQRYTEKHREVAFLLGGIGTGNVSLGARGELRDWELFNRPGKGNDLPCTFFCLRYRIGDQAPCIRILEAAIAPPYTGPNGWRTGRNEFPSQLGGVPRFAHSTMTVAYPFCRITFTDNALPFTVELEAFTPFIPLNLDESSLPCAVFSYRVINHGAEPIEATVAATLLNPVGFEGGDPSFEQLMGNANRLVSQDGFTALVFEKPGQPSGSPHAGTLALATCQPATAKPEWIKGAWWDGIQEFWHDLCVDGLLQPADATPGVGSSLQAPPLAIGSLAMAERIAPGMDETFRFALSWHFPNRIAGWWGNQQPMPTVRNHYATCYTDAADAARHALTHFNRLHAQSHRFAHALLSSTVPEAFLSAAMRNLTVMRSPTMLVTEGGRFMGWEGCLDRVGSCHGTCTHVYNYAQSMASLFPMLERSARETDFTDELNAEGAMAFRGQTGFGWERSDFHPAIDGQFGTIVRMCREWRRSGDNAWLKTHWPGIRCALNFGLKHWDPDGDGLPEACQHNTYDIEFYGPNPLGAVMMLAALKAGIVMAMAVNDEASASAWQTRLDDGTRAVSERLFDGDYYRQLIDEPHPYKYQHGAGCLSDQLMGQFMADCAGLGDLLPAEQLRMALKSIMSHNFIPDISHFTALHRAYALPGEQGLVLCTWPKGSCPNMPMTYADEIWSGVEYEVAALMIRRGMTSQAKRIVAAVNKRHDGIRRNPFNEAECGHHYARSMASWALIDACSGFACDMPSGTLSFAPIAPGRYFFACEHGWGQYVYENGRAHLDVYAGDLSGITVRGPGVFTGICMHD